LLHQSDIHWDKRVQNPQKEYKIGQALNVKILGIDEEKKRISLGLKQVDGDPWDKVEEKYKPGQVITAKITRLAEFGAFVDLEKNIEGLIHKTELAHPVPKKVEEAVKPGDEVTFKVLAVDTGKRRISLSVKAMKAKTDKETETETIDEEGLVIRKTGAFQKMLKKFLKKAKEENEESDEDEY
jgi:small subunit ribosomal protein S1